MESLSQDFDIMIGDELHSVQTAEIDAETSLCDYLRQKRFLTGTKVMCREGGCGVCIVAATFKHPVTKEINTYAINSCLVSILSCNNWKISTIEGIGNKTIGYHPIQTILQKFNGSQCGFCSPGMVMNMFALYQKTNVNMLDIEKSFGGNICRCTGYRSILAGFKSMAVDASVENIGRVHDIEDLPVCKFREECKRREGFGEMACLSSCFALQGARWYKVFSIVEIVMVFKSLIKSATYKLVAGNTAQGVYSSFKNADVYIDIADVAELKSCVLNTNSFIVGANITLTDAINIFNEVSKNDINFTYLAKLAEHIELIAHIPVRNIGTFAGNLSIKHEHPEFPSDIFLLLEAVNALLIIGDVNNKEIRLKVSDYLKFDMKKKILKKIIFPPLEKECKFESYKIMPRAQNAKAIVNAAFLLTMKNNVLDNIRIVYGCINPQFVRATQTENFLIGKNLFDNQILHRAYTILNTELKPDHVLPDPSPEFRKQLAIALFYKFVLSIAPSVTKLHQSGGQKLVRPLSIGTQDYKTQESMYPLTQPITKIEALAQTSGEAKYIIDMPDLPEQLFAAFVLVKAPTGSTITKIDASNALKLDEVVSFVDHTDIPGLNSFTPPNSGLPENEEIFCVKEVKYFFQPVGLVVATSQSKAEEGAALVKIDFTGPKKEPLVSVRQILKSSPEIRNEKLVELFNVVPKRVGENIKHVVKGTYDSGWQYHYHLETQTCNVVPTEDGFDIYPGTQWMDLAQVAGASCLGINQNKINVRVRRVGGAFGAKITRNSLVSCAALIAANKLRKPIKLWMPLTDNMNAIGKKYPFSADYEVGVDDKGVIQYLHLPLYLNLGPTSNDNPVDWAQEILLYTYKSDTFSMDFIWAKCDTPPSTWLRAPGSSDGMAVIETVMEHIAYDLKLDPLEVRLANLDNTRNPKLKTFVEELMKWANVNKRKEDVNKFNKENRWRKRAISVIPLGFKLGFIGTYTAIISIYHGDGSVSISHGGIEIGQGINTKTTQVVAHYLGIPVELVSVKPSNSLVSPNTNWTGGSITTESACMALLEACKVLNARMKPVKDSLKNPSWQTLVDECFKKQINLSHSSMFTAKTTDHDYMIYGVAAAEVEVDILTGNHIVQQVDLLEDTGNSLNPFIDIGQVEGAYMMGLGNWTSEEFVLSHQGEVLTNRTWNYKPPGARDIPVKFNVKFPENNPNTVSPLKSKATGEPPLCLAFGIPIAIKQAVKSARFDADPNAYSWYPVSGPSTVENIFMNCLNDFEQYTL